MMVKIITVFLLVMLVIGMVGKLIRPSVSGKRGDPEIEPTRKCATCGVYLVGAEPQPCQRADCALR